LQSNPKDRRRKERLEAQDYIFSLAEKEYFYFQHLYQRIILFPTTLWRCSAVIADFMYFQVSRAYLKEKFSCHPSFVRKYFPVHLCLQDYLSLAFYPHYDFKTVERLKNISFDCIVLKLGRAADKA
jgi:hypothetical protein